MTAKFVTLTKVDYIVIHSSFTTDKEALTLADVERIDRGKNLLTCGYHAIVRRDGLVEYGRPFDRAGVHTDGYNHNSIAILMIGGASSTGKPVDNYTEKQYQHLKWLLGFLVSWECGDTKPQVVGHSTLDKSTPCPCFDVDKWLLKEGYSTLRYIDIT